jgi:hypothetical protein
MYIDTPRPYSGMGIKTMKAFSRQKGMKIFRCTCAADVAHTSPTTPPPRAPFAQCQLRSIRPQRPLQVYGPFTAVIVFLSDNYQTGRRLIAPSNKEEVRPKNLIRTLQSSADFLSIFAHFHR